ncbi:MAG: nuclear transport factor 2 family protein [bacterium]|nr:nuclear transport factor 2 family protein [bacterium]
MKYLMTMVCLLMMISLHAQTSKEDMKAIKETITAFAKAGDSNDTNSLDQYLDDNFRIVMNQLFGSKDVMLVDKAGYIAKIGSKEWGGDSRELEFENITVNNTSASVKVIMKSSKSTFSSLITLIKNSDGKWKLVSDVPVFL